MPNGKSLVDQQDVPVATHEDRINSMLSILNGFEEFTLDLHGKIISSNLEVVCVTGYEEWEVIGKHFSMFYPEEDRLSNVFEQDLVSCEQAGYFRSESWKVKKRGQKFWSKMKIMPVKNALHTTTCFKVTLRDSTYRAFHEYKLRTQKNENIFLFNNSSVGIVRFDRKTGSIEFANKRASHLLEVAEGCPFADTFSSKEDYDTLASLIEIHRTVRNFRFQTKNGRWIIIDCKYFVGCQMVDCLLIDVTDIRERESTIAKIKSDLDTFLYHSSHELRAPISTALGLLSLMEREPVRENLNLYLSMLRTTMQGMDSILKDLAAITYNSSNAVLPQAIDFKGELENVIGGFKGNENVSVSITCHDDHEIYSDVVRVRFILLNVISNAVKFRNLAHERPEVKIFVLVDAQGASIQVADNGVGISELNKPNIFNPFFKGQAGGTGLGLYVVKEMINCLNGKIDVQSKLHEGTVVNIYLPSMPPTIL